MRARGEHHLRLATLLTGNREAAENLVQASLLKLYQAWPRLDTGNDDELIDQLAADGIAYVPFFPLGGFTPLQSQALSAVAARLGSAPLPVALAWLLRRSPNILLIPGTSSAGHLRENIAGAALPLSARDLAELDGIGR